MKNPFSFVIEAFRQHEKENRYFHLYKLYNESESIYKRIQAAFVRCFPIGSSLSELGTGMEKIIETYDLDNFTLKVIDLETGQHEEIDYRSTLEWNEFFYKTKGQEK